MTQKLLEKIKETGDADLEKQIETAFHKQSVQEEQKDESMENSKSQAKFTMRRSKVHSDKRRFSSSGKKKSIHKSLSKKQNNKSFIHIGHDNWNLVLHMMLGVRQSVKNVLNEEAFDLLD